MRFAATNLVVEEGVPDISRHSGYSLNIVLTFLIPLGVYAIAERIPIVLDQTESTEAQLAQLWVGVDSVHLLKQFRPLFV